MKLPTGARRLTAMARLIFLLIAVLAVALTIGCDAAPSGSPTASPTSELQLIALRNQPPPGPNHGCMEALLSGQLVLTPLSGIGVQAGNESIAVVWPFGYRAVTDGGVAALIDHNGQTVARVGDRIELGGGHGADGAWYPCHGQLSLAD